MTSILAYIGAAIAEIAALFGMVVPCIIEANILTISGPVIWFIVVFLTPFGMPSRAAPPR